MATTPNTKAMADVPQDTPSPSKASLAPWFPRMPDHMLVLLMSVLIAVVVSVHSPSALHEVNIREMFGGGGGGGRGGGRSRGRGVQQYNENMDGAPMMASMAMESESVASGAPSHKQHRRVLKKMSSPVGQSTTTPPRSSNTPPGTPSNEDTSTQPRMLVYHGNMNIHVDRSSINKLGDAAKEYVTSRGGYVQSSNSGVGYLDHRRKQMSGANMNLQLRVPSSLFRETMIYFRRSLAEHGEQDVQSESESVNDVTEQYVDQSSRAASLEGTHAALLKLMKGATTTKDVLSVRRELRQVVQELESKKAQMKSLKSQADYSHIHLSLNQRPLEDEPVTDDPFLLPSWRPLRSLKRALQMLALVGVWFGDSSIMVLTIAVPLFLVVFVGKKICCICRRERGDDDSLA